MFGTFNDLSSDQYVKMTCDVLGLEFSYDIYQNLIVLRKKPGNYSDTIDDVFLGPKEIAISRENFVKLAKNLDLYNYLKKWAEG